MLERFRIILHGFNTVFSFFGAVVVGRSFSSIVAVVVTVDVVADVVSRFRWDTCGFTSLVGDGKSHFSWLQLR